MAGGGFTRAGQASADAVRVPSALWTVEVGMECRGGAVVGHDRTIYVAGRSGVVQAFLADGTLKWSASLGREVRSTPALGPDVLYVATADGGLIALSNEGALLWEVELGSAMDTGPLVRPDGTVVAGTRGDTTRVVALSRRGRILWTYGGCGPVLSELAGSGDGGVAFVDGDGSAWALTAEGRRQWELDNRARTLAGPVMGPDGTAYIPGTNDIAAVAADGSVLWRFPVRPETGSPALSADGVVYVPAVGQLYALEADGTLRWKVNLPGLMARHVAPLVGKSGIIYLTANITDGGVLAAYSPTGEQLWHVLLPAEVYAPLAMDWEGVLYVVTYDGWLTAWASPRKGR